MIDFFEKLFATDFMPHGYCIRRPEIILLHEASDLVIALSYFLIPVAIVYLVRIRRDIAFPWMFWLFGAFILSCGTTHLLAAYVLWRPVYRLDGLVKAITAISSFPTAVLLIRLVPRVRLLASPEQLRQKNAALEREVSERKRAEAEVRRLNEELERRVAERTAELEKTNAELLRANDDLNHFAWASSHILREPLRMITIFSQLAERRESERLSNDGKYYLNVAAEGARRMQALVSDLLQYTEVATAAGDRIEASAESACEEAQANLAAAITESGAQIRRSTLPMVAVSHWRLVQLFQNLLSNAVKYHRDGAPPLIEVRAERRSGEWLFAVQDNGIGVSPQYHKQIFGVFKRLHGPELPGTGLGLPLCQRIVERHGGRIWVESEGEGKGSTFFFTMPAG